MTTFVTMDSSAGLTDDDLEEIKGRWGEAAAEDLIEKDFRSIRFDAKVLAAHYDEVVAALSVLPGHILDHLFKPMLMKAKPGAAEIAQRHAQTPEDLAELLRSLKMKNYIR